MEYQERKTMHVPIVARPRNHGVKKMDTKTKWIQRMMAPKTCICPKQMLIHKSKMKQENKQAILPSSSRRSAHEFERCRPTSKTNTTQEVKSENHTTRKQTKAIKKKTLDIFANMPLLEHV